MAATSSFCALKVVAVKACVGQRVPTPHVLVPTALCLGVCPHGGSIQPGRSGSNDASLRSRVVMMMQNNFLILMNRFIYLHRLLMHIMSLVVLQ
jgi:hypothetical protein